MVQVGSIPASPRSKQTQENELIKIKLQDNQEILIEAEIKITQKDIDFLFNGCNDVKEPTVQQVIDKAINFLNQARAVEVAEKKNAGNDKPLVFTDGEPDVKAMMELIGY